VQLTGQIKRNPVRWVVLKLLLLYHSIGENAGANQDRRNCRFFKRPVRQLRELWPGHMLAMLDSRPITSRRNRHMQLPTDLRQGHIGNVVTNRELGNRIFPNFPIESFTVHFRCLHSSLT
jgi:hypothetical protein